MADRRLQVFHAVARHLSFTKAAEELFMSQPAVTFQIKQLEEHFNARLFDRQHNRISLTPPGEMVMGYAARMLSLSEEMEARVAEMTSEIRGPLMIGASLTIAEYILPSILGAFKSSYPGVEPRLQVGNSETIFSNVQEHFLDLGLIESPSRHHGMVIETCCNDELVVVCAPDFDLADKKELTPKQLEKYHFVGREPGSGTREFFDSYLREHDISPDLLNRVMELGSPEAIKRVVGAGLGYTILSRAAVQVESKSGDLIIIPLKPRLIRNLSMIYPREKYRSRLVNCFIDFAKQALTKL